jgi:hypothetical protein
MCRTCSAGEAGAEGLLPVVSAGADAPASAQTERVGVKTITTVEIKAIHTLFTAFSLLASPLPFLTIRAEAGVRLGATRDSLTAGIVSDNRSCLDESLIYYAGLRRRSYIGRDLWLAARARRVASHSASAAAAPECGAFALRICLRGSEGKNMETKMTTLGVTFAAALAAVFICLGEAWAIPSCPVTEKNIEKASSYMDAVRTIVQGAASCPRAYQLMQSCQFGTSGDNELADMVQSKCEPLFLPTATPAVRGAYKMALSKCDKIAERNEGTMYMSFAAVCRAGASRDFARKYGSR